MKITRLQFLFPAKIRCYNRLFSQLSDSHVDFQAKKKAVPEGMQDVLKLIEKQVKENKIFLYMKGTPSKPQCGFSGQVVRILNALGVNFASVNILEFPSIREGVKLYSDWPTLPQLYIDGTFVGGCDIVTQMYDNGELQQLMKEKKLLPKE